MGMGEGILGICLFGVISGVIYVRRRRLNVYLER